ncbi:hypothetical protein QJS04_geneDACA012816 [Acorus gramineus]|uniref:Uncharacterized protein n=1 Tax=Acorus gramineus TaxID=55184 RepID=A0AAV9BFP7_ACOGR|nr:hypothetical protein QJS04_geneDACA012816 [Acorus gramineus]
MAMKPLTSEAIALTERKMDMTLDDIIKMSKKSSLKGKKLLRASIKSRGFANEGSSRGNSFKMQRFMNTKSSVRQGVLAQRRMNLNGTQLPLTTEFAGKAAAAAPVQRKVVNRNRPRIMALPVREVGSTDGFFWKQKEIIEKELQYKDLHWCVIRLYTTTDKRRNKRYSLVQEHLLE